MSQWCREARTSWGGVALMGSTLDWLYFHPERINMKLNRLKGHACYTIGPMEFCPNNGVQWREIATEYLSKLDILVLNPTNKPTSRAYEGKESKEYRINLLNAIKNSKDRESAIPYMDELSEMMKEIVAIDLRLLDKADFMLMLIDPTLYTSGSWVEFGMARLQRKPVVVFAPKGLNTITQWTYGQSPHSDFFDSLDKALDHIRHFHEDVDINPNSGWKFFDYDKCMS